MESKGFRCLDIFAFKLLALVTMTIDHTAAVLKASPLLQGNTYTLLRGVGRMAFPIYCFLLVEGYYHTRDVKKYASRLLLACALSEIPFDLALYGTFPHPKTNVMMTLLLGLLAVTCVDRGREALKDRMEGWTLYVCSLALLSAVSAAFIGLATFLHTDYRGGGVALILLFYLFRSEPLPLILSILLLLYNYYKPSELYALFALIPIALYSGKRGSRIRSAGAKWFFYLYYPLHLTVLVILRTLWLRVPMAIVGHPFP